MTPLFWPSGRVGGYSFLIILFRQMKIKEKMAICHRAFSVSGGGTKRLKISLEQQELDQQMKQAIRKRLKSLGDKNVDCASSEEKRDLIAKLVIKVCPSDDGKSNRIF